MADITFPAHITVRSDPDPDGVPVITADVAVAGDAIDLPLPTGPQGERGRLGLPRSTFRKMGAIADAAARPSGLGPEDRGKWWHRLDDAGMDVWTGTAWQHSPSAVGATGPAADANVITVTQTKHEAKLTNAAVVFEGSTAAQELSVTVPAGPRGPKGPPGASGAIADAADYDGTSGRSAGGVLGYQRSSRKFRPLAAPLARGPWAWYDTDFAADQAGGSAQLVAGTFTMPAQPFEWRPVVHGHLLAYCQNNGQQATQISVRLMHSEGQIVATALPGVSGSGYLMVPFSPTYSDEDMAKSLSPSSTFATVPAGQPMNLVLTVDRINVSTTSTGEIGYQRAGASLVAYAVPTQARR
ncbi:hypothetical protein [Nocardia bovistercoris]|uniref:Uncharacterized protein n=1 Tax=Nocardia bovistercoris TaxID=2785916 RepID=A0A931I962_9NOCA|nr:hypothetical protein [Nocardia bovistercoris]MBH0777009.1 hypothetical protein [Nocardia bovistercoris]